MRFKKQYSSVISVFIGVFICVTLFSVSLAAGNSDSAAQAAYKEAKRLFDQEQYAEAAEKFREAYELKPSWKILFNIGQSEAAAKNHGLALEAFELFLSEGGDDILNDRREQVISEVDRLRHMVGYLKVNAPKGTDIYIDGTLRGTAPVYMAFPVAAARAHTLSGTLNGTQLDPHEFRVVGAQTLTIDLESPTESQLATPATTEPETDASEPAPEATKDDTASEKQSAEADSADEATATPDATPEQKSKLKLTGWILTGVGGAALITGGVLGGVALKTNSSLVEECGDYCPEKEDEKQSNIRMANVATALFIGGGVVATTGIVMLIIGSKKEKQLAGAARMYPTISRDTVGAAVEWRF